MANSHQILSAIWPTLTQDEVQRPQYVVLLEYVDSEIESISKFPAHYAISTRESLSALINSVRSLDKPGGAQVLEIARSQAQARRVSTDMLQRSVDVALRLWLTINVSTLNSQQHGLLPWKLDQTLDDVIQSYFNKKDLGEENKREADQNILIPPGLTAESLATNHEYTISWTHNLAEHLTIDRHARVVTIYQHKICLHNHFRFADQIRPVIPKEILAEAIDTLNLLFPFMEDGTKRFLAKHKKPFYTLGLCGRPRKLDIIDYPYWGDRIKEIVEVSREPPVGTQQLKMDKEKKNFLSFATFWIAAVIGLLTVVSIGFGVAATVYAVLAYRLTLLQYELSLAQACLGPDARAQLPQFCS